MICTNDLLIIIGSIIKQLIESKSIVGDMWDVCSLMLGENSHLSLVSQLRVESGNSFGLLIIMIISIIMIIIIIIITIGIENPS